MHALGTSPRRPSPYDILPSAKKETPTREDTARAAASHLESIASDREREDRAEIRRTTAEKLRAALAIVDTAIYQLTGNRFRWTVDEVSDLSAKVIKGVQANDRAA